jgi:hypothetical protein
MNSGLSVHFYRLLMHAYPDEFRRRFGTSVEQAFRDMRRDAIEKHGYLGLALLWFHVIPDFLFSTAELLTRKAGDFLKWRFRLQWVVACSLGLGLARCIVLLIGLEFFRDLKNLGGPGILLANLLQTTILMSSVALLQSRVLAGRCFRKWPWVAYSLAGTALAVVVLQPLFFAAAPEIWLLQRINESLGHGLLRSAAQSVLLSIPMTLFGTIAGVMQAAAIKNDAITRYQWMRASAAGYFLSALVGGFAIPYPFESILQLLLTSVAAGALMGLVTSGPLERILFNVQADHREIPVPGERL